MTVSTGVILSANGWLMVVYKLYSSRSGGCVTSGTAAQLRWKLIQPGQNKIFTKNL